MLAVLILKHSMNLNEMLFNLAQSMPGFLLAIVFHEWAHGYVALRYGDDTAQRVGRLTLNPAAHFEVVGSLVVPLICVMLGGAVFGWAKPVPVDVRKLKNYRKGIFWVSFAGPLANILLGVISSLLYAIVVTQLNDQFSYYEIIRKMLQYSIFINFILAFFNLIPLPPLDGSKMVAAYLKGEALRKYEEIRRFTPMIFLVLFALSVNGVSILGPILAPAISLGNKLTLYFLTLLG